MEFRISLTGDLGSGKSTVGKILSEKFNAQIYSTGPIVRQIAKERGISVVDINKFMESDPKIDYEMDNRLKLLSDTKGSLIVDSRMAWFFTKGTFKVFLSTSIEESARRIYNDKQRSSESFDSIEETARQIRMRKESENMRYKNLYGPDCGFLGNYDLVVDTTASPAEKAAELIGLTYRKHITGKDYIKIYMYGGRLLPLSEITDKEIKKAFIEKEKIIRAPIRILIVNGEFYIKDSKDNVRVLRCIASGNNLIPCIAEYPDSAPSVSMQNKEKWQQIVNRIKSL